MMRATMLPTSTRGVAINVAMLIAYPFQRPRWAKVSAGENNASLQNGQATAITGTSRQQTADSTQHTAASFFSVCRLLIADC